MLWDERGLTSWTDGIWIACGLVEELLTEILHDQVASKAPSSENDSLVRDLNHAAKAHGNGEGCVVVLGEQHALLILPV